MKRRERERRIVKIAPGANARSGRTACNRGSSQSGGCSRGPPQIPLAGRLPDRLRIPYPANGTTTANKLWSLHDLQPGDLIVANRGLGEIVGVGEVQPPGYQWRPDRALSAHRACPLGHHGGEDDPTPDRWQQTIADCRPNACGDYGYAAPIAHPAPTRAPRHFDDLLAALAEDGLAYGPRRSATTCWPCRRSASSSSPASPAPAPSSPSPSRPRLPATLQVTRAANVPTARSISKSPYMIRYTRLVFPSRSQRLIPAASRPESPAMRSQCCIRRPNNARPFREATRDVTELSFRKRFRHGSPATSSQATSLLERAEQGDETAHALPLQPRRAWRRTKRCSTMCWRWPCAPTGPTIAACSATSTRSPSSTPARRSSTCCCAPGGSARRPTRERRQPYPFFAILDEMNLARVEHYFSDFLSALESGEPLHLHDDWQVGAGRERRGDARAAPADDSRQPLLHRHGQRRRDDLHVQSRRCSTALSPSSSIT